MNKIRIKINTEEKENLSELIQKIIKEKEKEPLHQYDCIKEEERWMTGLMGEMAVEKLTGLKIIDWEAGASDLYKAPDLEKAGYRIGIKTIKKENVYPLVPKYNTTAQIICQRDRDYVDILGIATVKQLNTYQDDTLVRDYHIRGRKTCFTGLEYLTDVRYLEMFKINR